MKYELKSSFVIPKGTVVTEEMMKWIKENCKHKPTKSIFNDKDIDLPDCLKNLFDGV